MSGNNLAVFVSGVGSNLQSLIDAERNGMLMGKIKLVVSNKKDALALQKAHQAKIQSIFLDPKQFETKREFDLALLELIQKHDISLVVLAGYMRILTPTFVSPMAGRIINIHPSLLPAYPGLNAIEQAYKAKEKMLGVTVHFVDQGVDTGPIIMQESLPVLEDETLEELTERVHTLEHRMLVNAVNKVIKGETALKEDA